MGRLFVEHMGGLVLYECKECGVVLSNKDQILSTHFQGSTGTAYLFRKVDNIRHGKLEKRNMITGKHLIRDIFCIVCDTKIGWMYEFAYEKDQQFKEGRHILELFFLNEVNGFEDPLSANPSSVADDNESHRSSPSPPSRRQSAEDAALFEDV